MKWSKPQITSVSSEMHATIGKQVTLRLSFSGSPQPTVAWTFKGRPINEDPSVEFSADGSLVIVCVEQRHAGRYIAIAIFNNTLYNNIILHAVIMWRQ
jgi:hypothetical protein